MRMGPHMALGSDPSAIVGARVQKGLIRRVWRFARAYRPMLAGFLATIVLAAIIDIVPPFLIRRIIDDAIPQEDRTAVAVLAGLMIVAALAEAALSLGERLWSSKIGEGLIYDLRVALFDHVQRMPLGFFTRTQTGALVSRMNNDVIGAQRAITGTLGAVVSNVVVVATTVVAMLYLEWRLTLISLIVLPLFVVPAKRVGRRLQDLTREQMDLNASMNTTMTERFGVAGAMLVKLFGRQDQEVDEFGERAGRVRDIGVKTAVYSRTFFIALGLVGAVGTALIYWFGSLLVISDALELGTLIALGLLVTRIYTPLTSLTNARVDLMTAFVSFDRVFEVLDTPNPIQDRAGAVDLVDPSGRIELDDVWFTYPTGTEASVASLETPGALPDDADGRPVLKGVSASMDAGTMTALVGPSGAGKSTVASLVPRLYDVTTGALRVDGNDVRDLTQRSLRSAIGVVTQDPHLFHETVRSNLLYARPGATDAELAAACRAARIWDVITALPNGLDTLVGERGYRLSGGEKQRLAIARMLLKDPCIVILDEATSHLDSENEAAVQAALDTALEGRTSVVIAHRLSTIIAADQILVLDEGRIVEQGTHVSLLAEGGLYADLYRTLVRSDEQDVVAPAP
ncbi:MAG TPA: ABC transporter ATP-binding protein [Acidimicrobiales bacterium]|nr:ABC transporter ATP-binding protein [Acidimicrobiales bacterium]